ncbi:hypothetical protein WJX74_004542 [Apatococcus lobatus]|uniref:Phosphoglycerate mutase n=1 Tax=Apatococcus lobatus TaxID=904363 RepID=A0AAW1RQH8_9CHLO
MLLSAGGQLLCWRPQPARRQCLQSIRPCRSVRAASSPPADLSNGASAEQLLDSQSRGNSVHVPESAASSSEISGPLGELRDELLQLKDMVSQQQRDLQRKDLTVSQLQNKLLQVQQELRKKEDAPKGDTSSSMRPLEAQQKAIADRRGLGMYDARYHSTSQGATPHDLRVLPRRIILVRHAESQGNVDNFAYSYTPDPQVPLTDRGHEQARAGGEQIKKILQSEQEAFKLFFYMSPYKRSKQTYEGIAAQFGRNIVAGTQEEVQLREQDFGNFQDTAGKEREKSERLRFGRFFYRFPNGESGADVYDRMTIFEDHIVRDINAGRFSNNTNLVLVSHGLALRIFLMRWFHWSVDEFMNVYNPPNCAPIVLERQPHGDEGRAGGPVAWIHTKALYRLTEDSKEIIKGCTDEMCSTSVMPAGTGEIWNSMDLQDIMA